MATDGTTRICPSIYCIRFKRSRTHIRKCTENVEIRICVSIADIDVYIDFSNGTHFPLLKPQKKFKTVTIVSIHHNSMSISVREIQFNEHTVPDSVLMSLQNPPTTYSANNDAK